jgi:hypothetical protein
VAAANGRYGGGWFGVGIDFVVGGAVPAASGVARMALSCVWWRSVGDKRCFDIDMAALTLAL